MRVCSDRPTPVRRRLHERGKRGFTLIELIIVVVIIGVFAALAVPGIANRLRDRRVQEAAQRIATLYTQARTRSMGRGSAVLVRFSDGAFAIREAQRGALEADEECAALPVSSCTTVDWNDPEKGEYRELPGLDLADRAEYGTGTTGVTFSMQAESGADVPSLDICFTPMGRTFSRSNFALTLQPLTTAHTAQAARRGFRTRRVLVLPNGTARLSQ